MRQSAVYAPALILALGVFYFALRHDSDELAPVAQPETAMTSLVIPAEVVKGPPSASVISPSQSQTVGGDRGVGAPPNRDSALAAPDFTQPLPEAMQKVADLAGQNSAAESFMASLSVPRKIFAAELRDEVWANEIEIRLHEFVLRHVNDQQLVAAPLSFECRATICELQTSETPDLENRLFNSDAMYGNGEALFRQFIRQEHKSCAHNRTTVDCIFYFRRIGN